MEMINISRQLSLFRVAEVLCLAKRIFWAFYFFDQPWQLLQLGVIRNLNLQLSSIYDKIMIKHCDRAKNLHDSGPPPKLKAKENLLSTWISRSHTLSHLVTLYLRQA